MEIINAIAYKLMKKRFSVVERFIQNPIEIQDAVFKYLIKNGKNTEWGKKYDYQHIRSWKEYNEKVPINKYENLLPYIQRMQSGEQNLLWNTPIKMFSKSSGTTGNVSKYIPVSKEALHSCHYKGGVDMLAIYCNIYSSTKVFSGCSLALGGSRQSKINDKFYCGDISAILMEHLPSWAEYYRVPNREIALMNEWESKLIKMAENTVTKNVVSLSGVPSWMSILLQRCIETTKKESISEIWKNIEVYYHGGVDFTPYKKKFHQLIPHSSMRYINVYNASEGYFGVQDQKDVSDMLLLLDNGIFYEFIETSELTNEYPNVTQLCDVKIGKNYAIMISTNAGLWRYLIGDTVTFTSKTPFRIQITGRTKNYINVCGEELIEDNANQAIKIACQKTSAEIREFTAAPYLSQDHKPIGHEWIIEFEREPEDKQLFITLLDESLKSVNSDYEAKRYKNLVLHPLRVTFAPKGTFLSWMKIHDKMGGQHKIPRLKNSREMLEDILYNIKSMQNDNTRN